MQRKTRRPAYGATPGSAVEADDDGRLPEARRETSGDDADDARMPPLLPEDDDRKPGKARVLEHDERLGEDCAVQRLSLLADGEDLLGERARLGRGPGEQEAECEVGLREPTRGVDARRVAERDVLARERVRASG